MPECNAATVHKFLLLKSPEKSAAVQILRAEHSIGFFTGCRVVWFFFSFKRSFQKVLTYKLLEYLPKIYNILSSVTVNVLSYLILMLTVLMVSTVEEKKEKKKKEKKSTQLQIKAAPNLKKNSDLRV